MSNTLDKITTYLDAHPKLTYEVLHETDGQDVRNITKITEVWVTCDIDYGGNESYNKIPILETYVKELREKIDIVTGLESEYRSLQIMRGDVNPPRVTYKLDKQETNIQVLLEDDLIHNYTGKLYSEIQLDFF